jgi:hypothetical protein
MRALLPTLAALPGDDIQTIHDALAAAIQAVETATAWLLENFRADPAGVTAGATPYLNLFAVTAGGWALGIEAAAAQTKLATRAGDPRFNEAKLVTARFFAEQVLSAAAATLPAITNGRTVTGCDPEMF